jgi:hypothetical protein
MANLNVNEINDRLIKEFLLNLKSQNN